MKQSRRSFLGAVAVGSVCMPLLLSRNEASAADAKVDLNDPTAVALEYTHVSEFPDKTCASCQLYTADASAEWGPCAIFPGKLVAGKGWCKSWIVKAG